jgi:organic hydroperoxide reductase OsmC/OhrA
MVGNTKSAPVQSLILLGPLIRRFEVIRNDAEGTMLETPEPGRFTEIVLRPQIQIRAGDDIEKAYKLHHVAHAKCYIANSVNFPIKCEPNIEVVTVT